MSDTVAASAPAAAAAQASPKKAKSSSKKPRVKPAHPRTSEMVISAIKSLKERGGSSLQAIKKYISANYKVDSEKFAPFIKKYLKTAVASGELVQTKGKGASGSFKLASASKPEKSVGSSAPARSRAPKEKKQSPAKSKRSVPKKSTSAAKRGSVKKQPVAAKPKKTPTKAKKAVKVPTKKPKAPKPKKVGKSKLPKRASPKKK